MNRRTRSFRWFAWLTLWVIGLAALAPTVSRALAQAGDMQWVQICTAQGSQWVQVSADGEDLARDAPAGSAALHLDHCPLCVLMSEQLAPPAAPPTLALAAAAQAAPAEVRRHAAPVLPVRAAPPRGPPALPLLSSVV